jgi:formylglycine-generating enzyme required for sulfatase activity
MASIAVPAEIARVLSQGPAATTFVELAGGRFGMGSAGRPDELPIREVTVGPFAVAITPVSNVEWAAFLEATGHEPSPFWEDERFNAPAQPVVGVSWFDAVAYCEWLSGVLGRECRLPTEAEREFAARGDVTDVAYPWGDEVWSEGAFAFGAAGTDRPLPIGSTPPNGYGLFHMGENVHEWCSDWYSSAGYGGLPADNPRGVATGVRRASRGGSWRHQVKVSRIASRSSLAPERRYNDYGMRVYAEPR